MVASTAAATGGPGGSTAASALVDILIEAGEGAPFREADLGGGPWVVVYTRGPLLWRAATSPGRLLAPRNEFSQAFSPTTRAVLNLGQLLGERLYVTAEGSYVPKAAAAAARTTPVDIVASIERGALHVLGGRVRVLLPIRGSGEVQLAYLGGPVRVFRAPSSGSVTVQVRRDELQRLLERGA